MLAIVTGFLFGYVLTSFECPYYVTKYPQMHDNF